MESEYFENFTQRYKVGYSVVFRVFDGSDEMDCKIVKSDRTAPQELNEPRALCTQSTKLEAHARCEGKTQCDAVQNTLKSHLAEMSRFIVIPEPCYAPNNLDRINGCEENVAFHTECDKICEDGSTPSRKMS